MKATAATILAALCVAMPAAAQDLPNLSLAAGESITIHFDDGGRVGPPTRGRAQWTPHDLNAARQLSGMTPQRQTEGMPMNAPESLGRAQIPADEVRLRMFSIDGRHTLLVVENGQGRALAYRAQMMVHGQNEPTDVCIVLPHLPSYEHWAFPIDRLTLSDFHFIPWMEGRAPTCE